MRTFESFVMCALGGHRLQCVLRLRRFVSVSETTEDSLLMKLHLKCESVMVQAVQELFKAKSKIFILME